jgi:hypothetical protein
VSRDGRVRRIANARGCRFRRVAYTRGGVAYARGGIAYARGWRVRSRCR